MQLRDYIAQGGISAAELASRLGVTREAIRRYATGERMPRRDMIRQIVEITGGQVTADDLASADVAA